MKWLMACVVGVCLVWPVGARIAYADAFTAPPPPNPTRDPRAYAEGQIPTYSIAAGVVAAALTGSFIALRMIRKRNGSLP
jgi:hypothetical protein